MWSQGQGICRCQDLREDAFGFPSVAAQTNLVEGAGEGTLGASPCVVTSLHLQALRPTSGPNTGATDRSRPNRLTFTVKGT